MAEINFGEQISVDTIKSNLIDINEKIELACIEANRNFSDVNIVAVTKNHSISTVKNAIYAGLNIFGENRYQELHEKAEAIRSTNPNTQWHFIGQIQRNKVARIADVADAIHSVDKKEQLDIIAKAKNKPQLLLQLSADGDTKRGGVAIDKAPDLMLYAHNVGPFFTGVMMVAPLGQDPRPHFLAAAEFAKSHGLKVISMGMSGDFEVAVQCGATHLRLGTALFGERNY